MKAQQINKYMLIDDLSQLPDSFKDGYRGVLLLLRNKDGETGNADRKAIKRITQNIQDWTKTVLEFESIKAHDKRFKDHRIYTSVNARDMKKAIHEFKVRQLQAQYDHGELEGEFYCDIKNRFFSCAMNPRSAVTKNFLIDCDTDAGYASAHRCIKDGALTILADYATRNGRHIIIEPCNPANFKWCTAEIKKDDLISIA